MLIQATKPLFACDCLGDNPSLTTIRQLLATIPDGSQRFLPVQAREECRSR